MLFRALSLRPLIVIPEDFSAVSFRAIASPSPCVLPVIMAVLPEYKAFSIGFNLLVNNCTYNLTKIF